MNKRTFLRVFGLVLGLTMLPFLGGLAVGKTTEVISQKTNPAPVINSLSYKSQPPVNTQENPVNLSEAVKTEPEVVPDPVPQNTPPPKTKTAVPKVAGTTTNPTALPQNCSGALAQAFVCLLNQYRAEKGLGKISYDTKLNQVALNHSSWMNTTGTFSHTGINGSRMIDRCAAAGTICLAENLAENILDAQKLLSSWQANPGHNKNLLGPYSLAGFGVSGPYVTLIFD